MSNANESDLQVGIRFNGRCAACKRWHTYVTAKVSPEGYAAFYVLEGAVPVKGIHAFVGTSVSTKHDRVRVVCGCAKRMGAPTRVEVLPVAGVVSTSHTCDNACLQAKGQDCLCSCGGRNHGAHAR
jgi:hypothetical protein